MEAGPKSTGGPSEALVMDVKENNAGSTSGKKSRYRVEVDNDQTIPEGVLETVPSGHCYQYIEHPQMHMADKRSLRPEEESFCKKFETVYGIYAWCNALVFFVSPNLAVRRIEFSGQRFKRGIFVVGFLGFGFHIAIDILESYMYRTLSSCITFFILFIWHMVLNTVSASAFMEMFYDIRKLRNGKSDAIERSQTITVLKPIIKKNNPKSVGIKALVIGALWMALLYSEGIVGMELESFGVGFVVAHAVFTTINFAFMSFSDGFELYSIGKIGVAVDALASDVHVLWKEAYSLGTVEKNDAACETALIKALVRLRRGLAKAERTSGSLIGLRFTMYVMVCVTVSISIATQDYSKKRFVLIYLVLILGPMLGKPMNVMAYSKVLKQLASLERELKELSYMEGHSSLSRYLHDTERITFRLLGASIDSNLVVRILLVVLSVGATYLQYYLLRTRTGS